MMQLRSYEKVKSNVEKDFIAMHMADVTKVCIPSFFFLLVLNFPPFLDTLAQIQMIPLIPLLALNITVPSFLAVSALQDQVSPLLTAPASQGHL